MSPSARTGPRAARRVPIGAAALATCLLAGCATSPPPGGVGEVDATPAGERSVTPPAPPALLAAVSLRGSDGPLAGASLAEVRQAIAPAPRAAMPAADPPETARLMEASRHYVRGRSALLEGRLLVAANEFERALALDPASADTLEELARIYGRIGQMARSVDGHERLLLLRPDHAEALFSTGVQAAGRGDFAVAIDRLARLRALPASSRDRSLRDFRPEGRLLADLALARALGAVGADRAAIEALEAARRDARSAPPAARVEVERLLGDALARGGDLPAAIEAWLRAGDAGGDASSLDPRLLWGWIALGRDAEARGHLAARLARLADAGGSPDDELVALAGWVARVRPELAASLPALAVPDAIAWKRLEAALVPNRAAPRLDEAVREAGPTAEAGLLREWAAAIGPDEALRRGAALVRRHPAIAEPLGEALVRSGPSAGVWLARWPASEPAVAAPLAAALGDDAGLERLARQVAAGEPDAATLEAVATAIARLGDERVILDLLARARGVGDAPARARILAALSEAARGAGDSAWAESIAEEALASGPSAPATRALVRARLDRSLAGPAELRGERIAAAIAPIEALLSADPADEDAWRLRLAAADAEGDPATRGRLRNEARRAVPGGTLDRQLELERLFAEGRVADALERAAARAVAVPDDRETLRTLVASWPRVGQTERLREFLLERQRAMPAETESLEALAATLVALGQEETAFGLLARRADGVPHDPFAAAALERLLAERGRADEAWTRAKARVARSAEPWPVRAELRLVALALEAKDADAARRMLEELAARPDRLSPGAALAAVTLAERLPERGAARDALAGRFAEIAAARPGPRRLAAALVAARIAARAHEATDRRAGDALAAVGDAWTDSTVEEILAGIQGFADDGNEAAASDFLATLLRRAPAMPAPAARRLATASFALDAIAGDRGERSLELLRLVRTRGVRPFSRDGDPAETEAEAIHRLSGLYSFLDDRGGAELLLRRALELDPDHVYSLNNLAFAAIERGELDAETVRRAERALELRPQDPSVLDTVGWLRYKQGRFRDDERGEGAISLLTRALRAAGDDPGHEPLDHLGDALWRIGDRAGAIRAWFAAAETVALRHPPEETVRALPAYERREHGVVLLDPRAFWRRSFGETAEGARRKAERAAAGLEPEVSPLAAEGP